MKKLIKSILWDIQHINFDDELKSLTAIIIACVAIGISLATIFSGR